MPDRCGSCGSCGGFGSCGGGGHGGLRRRGSLGRFGSPARWAGLAGLAWLLALGSAALPLAARAQDDTARDTAREGPYLALAGSFAHYTEAEDELDDVGLDADVDETLGIDARVGYRLHPHFAAEAEFEWLSEADLEVSGSELATIETWLVTLNGKGVLLTGRIQPFGLLGLGYMRSELEDSVGAGVSEEEDAFAVRVGGGLDLYLTPNVVGTLGLGYVIPTGDLDDVDYLSFTWGLGYRF